MVLTHDSPPLPLVLGFFLPKMDSETCQISRNALKQPNFKHRTVSTFKFCFRFEGGGVSIFKCSPLLRKDHSQLFQNWAEK